MAEHLPEPSRGNYNLVTARGIRNFSGQFLETKFIAEST
jgi:hypothetical protein